MAILIYYDNKRLWLDGAENHPAARIINDVSELDAFWAGDADEAVLPGDESKQVKALCKKYKYIEAAGGLVQNEQGQYLLMFRRGKWDLPKGKAEKGESHQQTALREVEEETGIGGLTTLCELPSTYHMYEEKGKTILKRTYWFAMKSTFKAAPVAQTIEGIEEVEWLAPKDFDKVMINTYPSVLEILKHV